MVHGFLASRLDCWSVRLETFPLKVCVTLFIIIVTSYQLAVFSWNMIHYFSQDDADASGSLKIVTQSINKNDVNKETSELPSSLYTLFGKANHRNDSNGGDSLNVRGRLPIKISGIITSSIPTNSIVIVDRGGLQVSYIKGDTIDGIGAVINDIQPNKVSITLNGQPEYLYLDESEQPISGTSTSSLLDIRKNLLKEPGKFADYISISPVKNGDKIQGYRLNPGADSNFFKKSGFLANDLAIGINGFDLRHQDEALKMMATLNEQTQFMITVIRDGKEEMLFIDLTGQ